MTFVRPATPAIDWMDVARLVLTSRYMDELEVHELTPAGKVPYQFSAGGHELADVLLAVSLDHPHDAASVYYRSRPFMLASGLTPAEAFAAGMARSGSPSEGRDIGVTFNLPRRKGALVLPMAGGVGSQFTPAAGWAQAVRYRVDVLGEAEWEGAVAMALGGDGSVASNGFWSALNIATTQRLPLVLVVLDNQYGLSVPSDLQTPAGDVSGNLASYGNLGVFRGDGTDPVELSQQVSQALAYSRSGEGPSLLHLRVPRMAGHTFVDDQSYKSGEFREKEARLDPIPKIRAHLASLGWKEDAWQNTERQARKAVEEAAREADSWPEPPPGTATRHLFFEGVPPLVGGARPEGVQITGGSRKADATGPRVNFVDAVRQALVAEMERNPRLLVFGEDVGAKGGVHGATRDMQRRFGPRRVFDTSLSEEGIIGRSMGMAMAGLLPVPEIQFRKYAEPAWEQISDLGTIRWRTGGKYQAPVVLRTPVGFGKVTGDPWHSMTGEALFAHSPGWRIAFPSNAADAVGLLRTALRGDDPTLFLEHRALLDTVPGRRPYPGDDFCLPFGKACLLAEGEELTAVSWGALVHSVVEAARSFPGRVEVVDLRTIVPWDRGTVLESVRKTGKVLVVHEDLITVGFGAEILSVIGERAFPFLDAPLSRLAVPDIPIPFNRGLMASVLPGKESIRKRMDELLAY